ncbi:MAG: cell surface protein [Candidatus Carbobacillus sp.]|nr:cell surface protein [Candidatus Carbobacillus sp.]
MTIVVAALIVGAAFGFNFFNKDTNVKNAVSEVENVDTSKLPIFPIRGSFVYDVNNINEAVGIVDYVFVGKVVRNDGTIYKGIITMESENGPKEVGTPYTKYAIQVIDNIKGALIDTIEVLKHGGVSQDNKGNKGVFIFEDDLLPEVDKFYIFLGYAQKDGSIIISGPNSNVPLNVSDKQSNNLTKQSLSSLSVYQQYQEAFENQIISVQRERFTSKYEK